MISHRVHICTTPHKQKAANRFAPGWPAQRALSRWSPCTFFTLSRADLLPQLAVVRQSRHTHLDSNSNKGTTTSLVPWLPPLPRCNVVVALEDSEPLGGTNGNKIIGNNTKWDCGFLRIASMGFTVGACYFRRLSLSLYHTPSNSARDYCNGGHSRQKLIGNGKGARHLNLLVSLLALRELPWPNEIRAAS